MDFKIPYNIQKFDKDGLVILNQVIDYMNNRLQQRTKLDFVTYTTNMNTDIAGEEGQLVYCSNDNKAYVCTTTGVAGSAVWSALN